MPRCGRSGIAGSRSCGTACTAASSTTKPFTSPTATALWDGRPKPPDEMMVDKGCLMSSRPFQDHCEPLPSADAEGCEPERLPLRPHLVRQREDDAGAAHPDRMA